MKFIGSIFCVMIFILSTSSYAVTEGQFSFETFVLRIKHKDIWGVGDDDSARLFQAMNVPITPGLMPGKVINTADKSMNIMCANQSQNAEEYLCSIVLRQSPDVRINSIGKTALVQINESTKAQNLFHQFVQSRDGVFEFSNFEGSLKIFATPERFTMEYQGQ